MAFKNLLSTSADAKTVKGQKLGYLTGILYLAPSDIAGRGNVCPMAQKAGCLKACLYTAGRGAFNSIQQARIAKTQYFFDNQQAFMLDLVKSIQSVIRKAQKAGLTPLIRLNGTSDIAWENIPVIINDDIKYSNIFEAFPFLQFYDYTKIPTRKNIPSNYDLTFSYSGIAEYQPIVKKALLNDKLARIAVVFDKQENIPYKFLGRDVLGGDNSDVRHLDKKGSIIALYAKGKAKRDNSGFVIKTV